MIRLKRTSTLVIAAVLSLTIASEAGNRRHKQRRDQRGSRYEDTRGSNGQNRQEIQRPDQGQEQVARGSKAFPIGPDSRLTTGSLCDTPSAYRYAEKIAYCNRDVEGSLKWQIIRKYDAQLGYRIETMNRGEFKIDHFYPLCAGGSNRENNLWPQHKSVYEITDPLEFEICEKMKAGRLRQQKAIELITQGKTHLDQVRDIRAYVSGL